jgi:threonine/homoserine/homoserine lactone efflux protein
MSFINLLPALGFLILNVFVPGPNVLNTIATAIGSGYRTGLACAVACGVGILLWATAALFGAAVFFQQYPLANKSLVIIGKREITASQVVKTFGLVIITNKACQNAEL